MSLRAIRVAFAIVVAGIACGCAAPMSNGDTGAAACIDVDIVELYRDPFAFDNETVCTQGFYSDRGQPILHIESNPDRDSYYDIQIIIDDPEWILADRAFADGDRVSVEGSLTVHEGCWRGRDETAPGEIWECVPFRRPIDLEITTAELVMSDR